MDNKKINQEPLDTKEVILDVKNLNTTFMVDRKPVRIVKNVSFQIKRGHALAVVGALLPMKPSNLHPSWW